MAHRNGVAIHFVNDVVRLGHAMNINEYCGYAVLRMCLGECAAKLHISHLWKRISWREWIGCRWRLSAGWFSLVMVSQSFRNLLNLAVSAAEQPTWHGRLLQRLSAGKKCKRRLTTWCCSGVGRWRVDDGKWLNYKFSTFLCWPLGRDDFFNSHWHWDWWQTHLADFGKGQRCALIGDWCDQMRAWKCRLKPGIVLTSTSKAPGNGTLAQRSLNQFSPSRRLRCTVYPWKMWAAAGVVANLSEVVSGKQWEETSILIQTAAPELSPFVVLWVSLFQHSAAPLCKFKQPVQRWSHQIYWNQWFGSLNLLVVPDVETIGWSGAGCALDHCSPAFWAASDTYGFVWKLGRNFQNNTCFIACPCSRKTKIVRLPQPMSWDNSHGRQQEKVAVQSWNFCQFQLLFTAINSGLLKATLEVWPGMV